MGLGSCWECARRAGGENHGGEKECGENEENAEDGEQTQGRNAGLEAAGWSGEKMADSENRDPLRGSPADWCIGDFWRWVRGRGGGETLPVFHSGRVMRRGV